MDPQKDFGLKCAINIGGWSVQRAARCQHKRTTVDVSRSNREGGKDEQWLPPATYTTQLQVSRVNRARYLFVRLDDRHKETATTQITNLFRIEGYKHA